MVGNIAKAPRKDKVSELLGTIARTTPDKAQQARRGHSYSINFEIVT